MRVLIVFGLFYAGTSVVAEDVTSVSIEQEKSVAVAQVEPKEEVVVAQVEPKEEPVVQVAQADVKESIEDSVQVADIADIDQEILEAAEKVLAEDPATQVATAEQEFDLNFNDFEFDEEEGI